MKKVLFALLLFVLAFALPVTVYTLVNDNIDSRERAAEENQTAVDSDSNTAAPNIISIPITDVDVGEEYSYLVKASDPDSSELTYYINNKPAWVEWDENLHVLKGVPGPQDVGAYYVYISVSDGKWLDEQKFQIEVHGEGGEESIEPSDTAVPAGEGAMEDDSESDTDGESSSSMTGDGQDYPSQDSQAQIPDYGLVDSGVGDETEGQVLGETDTRLPNTALNPALLALSGGFAILCVSLFLFLDAKMDLLEGFMENKDYSQGKQIVIRTPSGTVIKKRQIEV